LGPPTRQGQVLLAACMTRGRPTRFDLTQRLAAARWSPQTPLWLAAATGSVVIAVVVGWPHWQGKSKPATPTPNRPSTHTAKQAHRLAVEHGSNGNPNLAMASINKANHEQLPQRTSSRSPERADLVLPIDRPLRITSLPLRKGQKVCGEGGQRATL